MAAEQVVATQGQQIEGENNANIDINDWLKQNRLLNFKEKFQEFEINMDDLLNYSEQQIESVMNDCGITTSVHQIRFKDGIRKLQAGNVQNENRIYRIIMTAKESEAVKILNHKLTKNNDTKNENLAKRMKIEHNTEKYKDDIQSTFDMLRNALNEREKLLIKQLNDATNNQLNKLKKQQQALTMYDESIKKAQNEQNAVLLDPNINATKREMRIDQITTDTLNEIDDTIYNIHTDMNDVRVIFDVKFNKEYISNIGSISDESQINGNKLQNAAFINKIETEEKDFNVEAPFDAKLEHTEQPSNVTINSSATITWSITNTGYSSFGDNCKLSYVSGDGLLVSQYNIPNAKPNETVKVSVVFTAFSVPGLYETIFRLSNNNKKFGPSLIVKINVFDIMPPPPSYNDVMNGWFASNKEDVHMGKASDLKCPCGATLYYLDVKKAYNGKSVWCDICSKLCKQNILHCPNGDDIKFHAGGYDLCHECGGFVYRSKLKQLLDMGFVEDKSRRLLLKHRGNMSQVLADLIK